MTTDTIQPIHIEDYYCQQNGRRMHFQVAGPADAMPLVLLHGWGGYVNWWQRNLPVLTQAFRCYVPDMPGFGRSQRLSGTYTIEAMADFVRNWLDWMNLQHLHLLGSSMGGQVAVRLAVAQPDRFGKLVLAAPSGLWLPLGQRLSQTRSMPKVRVPLKQQLTVATGTMRSDKVALVRSLLAVLGDKQAAAYLSRLTNPTLLLWGTADVVLPPALATVTLELMQNAPVQLEYVPNGTHDMMFDQAETFNRLTFDFLTD